MAENTLADMSTEFAIQILKLTDSIKASQRRMQNEKGTTR